MRKAKSVGARIGLRRHCLALESGLGVYVFATTLLATGDSPGFVSESARFMELFEYARGRCMFGWDATAYSLRWEDASIQTAEA